MRERETIKGVIHLSRESTCPHHRKKGNYNRVHQRSAYTYGAEYQVMFSVRVSVSIRDHFRFG